MPLTLTEVHKQSRDPSTNRMVLVSSNPYKRFIQRDEGAIILQAGNFYDDGGGRIRLQDVPKWVLDQVAKVHPKFWPMYGITEQLMSGTVIQVESEPEDEPSPQLTPETDDEPEDDEGGLDVVDIVAQLNPSDDAHWTKDGKPDLNVLKEALNRYVSRKEVEGKTNGLRRPTQ